VQDHTLLIKVEHAGFTNLDVSRMPMKQQHASQNAPTSCAILLNLFMQQIGERLVEELAPELTPMLASLEMPANFVPVTNAVFAEMARRGIGRQQILTALRKMGTELPQDSVKMMQVCC